MLKLYKHIFSHSHFLVDEENNKCKTIYASTFNNYWYNLTGDNFGIGNFPEYYRKIELKDLPIEKQLQLTNLEYIQLLGQENVKAI